jgi:hypothetical protein
VVNFLKTIQDRLLLVFGRAFICSDGTSAPEKQKHGKRPELNRSWMTLKKIKQEPLINHSIIFLHEKKKYYKITN